MNGGTNEELVALYLSSGNDAIYEKLYKQNYPLVYKIVMEKVSMELNPSKDEIGSIGMSALVSAIAKFKPGRGAKFSSIFALEIKSEVRRYNISRKTIYVPGWARRRVSKSKVQPECDLSDRKSANVKRASEAIAPMDSVDNLENSPCELDTIIEADKHFVAESLGLISKKARDIIRMRFGIGRDEMTLTQIARKLKCSPEGVRKKLKSAMVELKTALSVEN